MEDIIRIDSSIRLTSFVPEDKPCLLWYLNDREIYNNTLRIPHPYTAVDADEWLSFTRACRNQYGIETQWAIRHDHDGLIGGIGRFVHSGLHGHVDEIGYWLAAPYRGRGLMTTVVAAVCAWLFDATPLVRIEAKVFPHNPASVRVLEKAGFEREGYARKLHLKDGVLLDSILLARIKVG